MALTAFHDEQGFTLIEVLVAMLVMLIGLLGSLLGVMAAVEYNLGNVLRNEAVRIVQQDLEDVRNTSFAGVVTTGPTAVQRQVRKGQQTFQLTRTVDPAGTANLKVITETVTWTYKNRNRSYSVQSIIRQ
jgi:type IV pilus assembly protein PilV